MKTKSLVKITEHYDGGFHLTFFRPTFSLFYAAMSREHCLAVATRFLGDQLKYERVPWVDSWSRQKNNINCPEGCISLPADIWKCKLTDLNCSIQASIDLSNKEIFMHGCHATQYKKEQIWKTVQTGKYQGFHHVPGRSLCTCCEFKGVKKESFKYFYPWEFAELDVAILSSYEETYNELEAKNIPVNYVMSPICAECCRELAIELRPELESSLFVIEMDFHSNRKCV